ncbi:hypothetical protein [Alsobacter sp. R-9]
MGSGRRGGLPRAGAVLLLVLAGPTTVASVSARAATSCVATYDRTGAVTGRYCSDGPAAPDDAEPTAAPAPRGDTRRPAARPLPRGVDIRCTAPGRCRGSFERP